MRVISGIWRGRPLVAPKGEATRPTADRTREGLFSMLVSRALPCTRVASTSKPASSTTSAFAVSRLIHVAGPTQPSRDSLSSATSPAPVL